MKNILLILSFAGSVVAYILFNTRDLGLCNPYCGDWVNRYQDIFVFFPVVLIFSLLTYKMPSKVFIAWWKFARFAVPIILFVSWVISLELHHNPGGYFNMDNSFDLLSLLIMYFVFVTGSLIQIWRGYRSK